MLFRINYKEIKYVPIQKQGSRIITNPHKNFKTDIEKSENENISEDGKSETAAADDTESENKNAEQKDN